MTYKKQVEFLNAQIASLQQQVNTIQAKCQHKKATEKSGGIIGDYCRVDYSCKNCGKTWVKYLK